MSHANTSSKKKIAENESVLNEEPDLFGQDDEFDSELLAAFKIEADELLEVSEGQLLILESEPTGIRRHGGVSVLGRVCLRTKEFFVDVSTRRIWKIGHQVKGFST